MTTESFDEQDRSDMARLVAGQDSALNDLMGRHAEKLFHYLLRILQNETEAADLAQETFVRVYLHQKKYKPAHKFSTWLYTRATNLARDIKRSQARHPQVSLDAERDDTNFHEALPENKPNPGESLESAERAEAVRQAIAQLSEDLRVPLVLSEYGDKSHAEIATILNCSPKAVEMRLYRARQQLRTALAKVLI